MFVRSLCAALVLAVLTFGTASAQSSSPVLELGPDLTLNPGLFLQSGLQAGGENEDASGFSLTKSWVNGSGSVGEDWSYLAQVDVASEVSLLDARLAYAPDERVELAAGVFKAPVSREWLTPAPRISFTTRARAVNTLSPKRELGVSASVAPISGIRLIGGLFNGNGPVASGNDDGRFLYTGRVVAELLDPDGETVGGPALSIGASGALKNAGGADGSPGSSDADWTVAGADLAGSWGALRWSSEVIYRELRPGAGAAEEAWGGQVTGAADLPFSGPAQVLLLRWDRFRPFGAETSSDLMVIGYSVNADGRIGGRINYRLPLQDAAEPTSGLYANLQLVW